MSSTCHICNQKDLHLYPEFSDFYRVTSDTKPWKKGGEIGICLSCGTIQKPITKEWQDETSDIYNAYELYYQSDSYDQIIFDSQGNPKEKNSVILENADHTDETIFSLTGHLLDIGCGRGAFLRAFNKYRPDWEITGNDIGDRYKEEILGISTKSNFISGGLEGVTGTYDVISMCHVLEHVVDPVTFLNSLRDHLVEQGTLFIQVPDIEQNPYDLFVADHCTHFSLETLTRTLRECGFEISYASNEWAYKELSVVATKTDKMVTPDLTKKNKLVEKDRSYLENTISQLTSLSEKARNIAAEKRSGIFGTAVAGIWLDLQIEGKADLFLDEDKGRVGKVFMDRPVMLPSDAPTPLAVLIPIRKEQADLIAGRVARDGIDIHILSLENEAK